MNTSPPLLVCFAVRAEAKTFQKRKLPSTEILITAMGAPQAKQRLEDCLSECSPSCVISSGFAGALDPSLSPGEIVFDADPQFPVDIQSAMPFALAARLETLPSVLVTAEEKHARHEISGAAAVDMESQAIRSVCWQRNIPSATVRAISDTCDESLPLDFNRYISAAGEMKWLSLAFALASSPSRLRAMLRFQKQISTATSALGEALLQIERLLQAAGRS